MAVKLRQKKISKGRKSLYLDIYPPIPHPKTGEPTRREFLGLYLFIDKVKPAGEVNDEVIETEISNETTPSNNAVS